MGLTYAGLGGEWESLFYQAAKGKPPLLSRRKARPLLAEAKRNPSRHDYRLLDPAFDADFHLAQLARDPLSAG
jgi:hypothetical protein